MTPRLATVFLICDDLSDSVRFYTRLGFSLIKEGRRSKKFRLGPALELHLHERLEAAEQQRYHVAYQVASTAHVLSFEVENLEEFRQRLEPRWMLVEPQPTPWGTRMLMLRDPDGHRLEFQERLSEK